MEKGGKRMKLGLGKIKDALKGVTAESTSEGKKEHVEGKNAGRQRRNSEDKK